VQGLPQDPQKFLTAGEKVEQVAAAAKTRSPASANPAR
jgi:hypothetical protein